jgi:hypothetical protein
MRSFLGSLARADAAISTLTVHLLAAMASAAAFLACKNYARITETFSPNK